MAYFSGFEFGGYVWWTFEFAVGSTFGRRFQIWPCLSSAPTIFSIIQCTQELLLHLFWSLWRTTQCHQHTWRVTVVAPMLALTPSMFLRLNCLSSSLERTSCPIMNKYEDSRSPFLRPLVGLNWPDLPPLTKNSEETEDIQGPEIVTSFFFFVQEPKQRT